ncbi:MAG: DUF3540 domain-containing protein [Polyangiaceae bacterium]
MLVRLAQAGDTEPVVARMGWLPGYVATPGDRVLVVADDEEHVISGVLRAGAPAPNALFAPDGARAQVSGGAIELFDGAGHMLVRYRDGQVEVAPATGDLKLAAPHGRVLVEAATDIELHAARDVSLTAHRAVETTVVQPDDTKLPSRIRVDDSGASLTGKTVEVKANRARTIAAQAELLATAVRTSATTIETTARKIDTTVERASIKAKEVLEQVSGLLDTRAGRVRSLVKGAMSLRAKTSTIKSEDDTVVDGRRVLLG